MAGETGRFLGRLTAEMKAAAAELDFERAARLRDDIGALERVLEKSAVVLPDATDADVFALAEDELEVAVQLFHVRGGRVRGQRGWVAERDAETTAEVVEHLLQRVYGSEEGEAVPREVLVPVLPDDADGPRRVALRPARQPGRPAGARGAATSGPSWRRSARNAQQSLARHKVARAGDLTTRSQALQQIQDALALDEAPLRIECFDISHVQGTQVVGSMVVFEDGLPRKSEYRRFLVRGDETGATDDTAAMHEVLTRRFRRGQREEAEASQQDAGEPGSRGPRSPEGGSRPARFAYRPNLVVVDGGLPQVNAAARALADCGVVDVAVVGLAKRLEEVWVPGEDFPVVLPRTSEGLYLLQRLRDEAHRFAVTFHRQRRSKAMTASQLDGIPGLGEKRRKALLRQFGSVKRIRAASVDELADVPGIGPALAAVVAAELGSAADTTPAVNLATGEVVDDEGARPCRRIGRSLTAAPRRRGRRPRCPGPPTSSSSRG